MTDLKINKFRVSCDPISRLSLLQVEPFALDFDGDDSAHRAAVFTGVMNWLAARGPASPSRRLDGSDVLGALEPQPRPQVPRVISFPELYTPWKALLDIASPVHQEGEQVVLTGLATSRDDTPVAPFFDAASLARLLEHPTASLIRNDAYVRELLEQLRHHGKCANLAASFAVDRLGKRHLLIHTKVIPSKYEQRHRYEHNTIEGSELQTIELHWNSGKAQFVLLPLICSDFAYRHEALRHSVLHKITRDRVNVDLLCVLSVQKCHAEGHPPWPREYQLPTLEVAEQRFTEELDCAHTMMTNVGRYTLDKTSYPAGFSFLSLQNGEPWAPHGEAPIWDGTIWYFGKLEPGDGTHLPNTYAWAQRRPNTTALHPLATLTKHIAGLMTHDPVLTGDAVLQHFEISVGRVGRAAWQSGRLFIYRLDGSMEQL